MPVGRRPLMRVLVRPRRRAEAGHRRQLRPHHFASAAKTSPSPCGRGQGRGWGSGDAPQSRRAILPARITRIHPPPQPFPTRGEGAGIASRHLREPFRPVLPQRIEQRAEPSRHRLRRRQSQRPHPRRLQQGAQRIARPVRGRIQSAHPAEVPRDLRDCRRPRPPRLHSRFRAHAPRRHGRGAAQLRLHPRRQPLQRPAPGAHPARHKLARLSGGPLRMGPTVGHRRPPPRPYAAHHPDHERLQALGQACGGLRGSGPGHLRGPFLDGEMREIHRKT